MCLRNKLSFDQTPTCVLLLSSDLTQHRTFYTSMFSMMDRKSVPVKATHTHIHSHLSSSVYSKICPWVKSIIQGLCIICLFAWRVITYICWYLLQHIYIPWKQYSLLAVGFFSWIMCTAIVVGEKASEMVWRPQWVQCVVLPFNISVQIKVQSTT